MPLPFRNIICGVFILFGATAVFAQDDEATRYPLAGIPILDCAPHSPAPQDTCLVRLPPRFGLADLQSDALGPVEGAFRLVKPGRVNFPDDVNLSATLLLVDLSPGPNAGRRSTFEFEKELLLALVEELPRTELIAIYGFNEDLRLFQDFTTDLDTLADTIDALELGGSNTRIGTFVSDSITVLADRDDILLRNLILVSDGQEEGSTNLDDVVAKAIEEGVVISAVGSFWRSFGSSENGAGMDYLRALTEGTSGITAQAQLDRPNDARTEAQAFGNTIFEAIQASGLILPDGEPQPSTITMILNEPVLGAPGDFRESEISAVFRPVQATLESPQKMRVCPQNLKS
ncbi:VWA domain-containing protein [Yoonia algicola]|uniref:VWA domain-containing protein n=1 Tax=Yoonia algicola TaxID=3137368 RepID=A0AAN0NGL7_9RHOB